MYLYTYRNILILSNTGSHTRTSTCTHILPKPIQIQLLVHIHVLVQVQVVHRNYYNSDDIQQRKLTSNLVLLSSARCQSFINILCTSTCTILYVCIGQWCQSLAPACLLQQMPVEEEVASEATTMQKHSIHRKRYKSYAFSATARQIYKAILTQTQLSLSSVLK